MLKHITSYCAYVCGGFVSSGTAGKIRNFADIVVLLVKLFTHFCLVSYLVTSLTQIVCYSFCLTNRNALISLSVLILHYFFPFSLTLSLSCAGTV